MGMEPNKQTIEDKINDVSKICFPCSQERPCKKNDMFGMCEQCAMAFAFRTGAQLCFELLFPTEDK